MNRRWTLEAYFLISEGQEKYVVVEGPAPRIYEALGQAKSAIALKYPSIPTETIEFSKAEAFERMDAGTWEVTYAVTVYE